MIPLPIPWTKLWQFKVFIPMVLASLFLFFAMGAVLAHEHTESQDMTEVATWVNGVHNTEEVIRNAAHEDTPPAVEEASVAVGVPVFDVAMAGYWWGYEHSGLAPHMLNVAQLVGP